MSASFLSKAHTVVGGFPRATIKWPRSVFPDDPVARSLLAACTQEVQAVDA
jgi:hypothetical protein